MAKTEFTISTLKELVEQRITALEQKCAADKELLEGHAEQVASALTKQATEYERRLSDLNHEAARIAAANASNVSREVYDADKGADNEWKRRVEGQLGSTVPQTEFRAYKESTSSALTKAEGRTAGIGGMGTTAFQIIVGLAAAIATITSVVALTSRSSPSTVVPVLAVPSAKP